MITTHRFTTPNLFVAVRTILLLSRCSSPLPAVYPLTQRFKTLEMQIFIVYSINSVRFYHPMICILLLVFLGEQRTAKASIRWHALHVTQLCGNVSSLLRILLLSMSILSLGRQCSSPLFQMGTTKVNRYTVSLY